MAQSLPAVTAASTPPALRRKTVTPLGPSRGTLFVERRGGAIIVQVAGVNIASAFTMAKLERLGGIRARYDAACARAASLYVAGERSTLWVKACDHASALSKMIPLTVAKKDKDGKYIVPEWDV